jgi:hypothetical protein
MTFIEEFYSDDELVEEEEVIKLEPDGEDIFRCVECGRSGIDPSHDKKRCWMCFKCRVNWR